MQKLPNHFFLIFFFIIFTGLVLSPGLSGPYIYDDHKNLVDLKGDEVSYESAIFENDAGPIGRSVTMATFVVNHWIRGELDPFDLKLTSLFIHLVNGILLFYLISLLLKIKLPEKKAKLYASLIAGLWLISPVNSGVVFYIIQRATLLATTFMLISCIAYVKNRSSSKHFNFNGFVLVFISIASWIIAMFSKENAVLLPLIILILDICFFNSLDINRIKFKSAAIWSIIMISFLFVSFLLLNSQGFLDFSSKDFSLLERVFTQPIVIVTYIQEILAPVSVDVSLYRSDDLTIRESFWNYATISSLILIIGLILIALYFLKNEKYKCISAGILIFFTGHLLESTIFPLELFFRHRNYFPSIGLYLSLIFIIDFIFLRYKVKKIIIIFFIFYFSFLGLHSYTQAKVWSSYDSILLNALEKHPEAMGGNLVIVGELVKRKDIDSSLSISNMIISSRPLRSLPLKIQRFYVYCELANTIPEKEYELLDTDINLIKPKLISLSLFNLMQSYNQNQCKFIDLKRITNSLTNWTTEQLLSAHHTALELWSIDYYMVEFLLLLGEQDAAVELLDLHIEKGNQKAELYKKEVLNM